MYTVICHIDMGYIVTLIPPPAWRRGAALLDHLLDPGTSPNSAFQLRLFVFARSVQVTPVERERERESERQSAHF